jgi:hypothetical protein
MPNEDQSKPVENADSDSGASGTKEQKPLQQHPSRAAKPQPNVAIKSTLRGNLKK